jgi:hypothetical protein
MAEIGRARNSASKFRRAVRAEAHLPEHGAREAPCSQSAVRSLQDPSRAERGLPPSLADGRSAVRGALEKLGGREGEVLSRTRMLDAQVPRIHSSENVSRLLAAMDAPARAAESVWVLLHAAEGGTATIGTVRFVASRRASSLRHGSRPGARADGR